MKVKAVILRNELEGDHHLWIKACEDIKEHIDYRIVDLTLNNWLEEIKKSDFDVLLAKPGGLTSPYKQLYDERIYILGKILGYYVFPSPEEIFIYENKRFLSFWLKANNISHPDTHIFYNRSEALKFIENLEFPVVAKSNIGASGSGVRILTNYYHARKYIIRSFASKGAPKRTGPNIRKGDWMKRGIHYIFHPGEIQKKIRIYRSSRSDIQSGFVILQEYIGHDFEWRVVRIGNSFFAHKKLKAGEKASGTLKKLYENPPFSLLDYVKHITDNHQFYSQAIDIFECNRGYLVNEMQCIFGQSDEYQMLVDGKPGRYLKIDGKWHFEEGDFAKNACYNLRIEYVLSKILTSESD
jgi:glutathione synthase/RimK-type ligase-like ATP-grasp enzyme